MNNNLVKWNEIEHQIDEARDLKTIIKMQEQVDIIKILVKQTEGSLKAQNKCSRYRIFLEQRAGKLYRDIKDKKGGDFQSSHRRMTETSKQAFKKESGKGHNTISRWVKESGIPEGKVLEFENKCNEGGEELTTAGLLKHVQPAHVSQSTGENEWYIPEKYIIAAKAVMGDIDVDPASSEIANQIITAKKYHTIEDNGLTKSWEGRVWMNPPYAQPLIVEFSEAFVEKYKNGEIKEACVLINNATETTWLQILLNICSQICFIKGRIKFIDIDGKASGAPLQGQLILYFGNNSKEFNNKFSEFGVIK